VGRFRREKRRKVQFFSRVAAISFGEKRMTWDCWSGRKGEKRCGRVTPRGGREGSKRAASLREEGRGGAGLRILPSEERGEKLFIPDWKWEWA